MMDKLWARERASGDQHPLFAAASTSQSFANSFRFFVNAGRMHFTQRQRPVLGDGQFVAAICRNRQTEAVGDA